MTTMTIPFESLFQEIETKKHFPDWLNRTREAAYHNFLEHGFPTLDEEAWKYLNLKPLLKEAFVEPADIPAADLASLTPWRIPESKELVFINGRYQKNLSNEESSPVVQVLSLEQAFSKFADKLTLLFPRNQKPFNAFSDINTFSFDQGAFLGVAEDVQLKTPAHFLFLTQGKEDTSFVYYPRMVIHIAKRAKAQLFIQFSGSEAARFLCNSVLDVIIEEGGELELVTAFTGRDKSVYFGLGRVQLKANSRFVQHKLNEADGLVRQELHVDFKGPGASCDLNGLSILESNAESFQHVTVNHHVPDCKSRQLYKNILTGKARSEFNGLVYVAKGAARSDSGQLNRNLILSDEAKAYSRPQLKIFADDVQCTHGSATGQLEQEQIFYLNSRGLSRQKANSILTYGFAEEIIERVTDAGVRKRLDATAISKLMKIKY